MTKKIETEVCIIGGGATGAGIFRDLTLRGISAVLVEKNDLATGTSGRNHGLLHSGARYAVKDKESAVECITENQILKKIGKHCVEDTGGFFIGLNDEDIQYSESFMTSCRNCGIDVQELSLKEAFRLEPHLHPQTAKVLQVPDGSVDPFRLVLYNAWDGMIHGGQVFRYSELMDSQIVNNHIDTALFFDHQKKEEFYIQAAVYINAAGPWAGIVAQRLGSQLAMAPSMGVMVILDYRIVNHVINRLRPPADGDIIVPGETVSIIGTTSRRVTESELDHLKAKPEEVRSMIQDAATMIPDFSRSRMLRYYSGARPLPDMGKSDGREISRNFLIREHGKDTAAPESDNLISIVGGKLMTYRLMAEKVSNLVAARLNNTQKCTTAEKSLPPMSVLPNDLHKIQSDIQANFGLQSGFIRQGRELVEPLSQAEKPPHLLCECEMVTEQELLLAALREPIYNIADLRRRTRIGMGPCQGTLCTMRAMETEIFNGQDYEQKKEILERFIQERWKGIRHVLWGDSLRMEEFSMWLYQGIWGW